MSPVPTPRPKVILFDHTLIWPVILHDCDPSKTSRDGQHEREDPSLQEWRAQICSTGTWKHVAASDVHHDDIERPLDSEYRQLYEEVVYFHPFVRKFLYDRPKSVKAQAVDDCAACRAPRSDHEFEGGIDLFERDDVHGVTVGVYRADIKTTRTMTLGVSKVQLFLFDTFVAMLVVRLTNRLPEGLFPAVSQKILDQGSHELDLDDVLALQEVFRRAYPPFWFGSRKSVTETPGYMPSSLDWLNSDGQRIADRHTDRPKPSSNANQQQVIRSFVHQTVQSPVVEHFQFLMHPLIPYEFKTVTANERHWLAYRQILDERIPVVNYLAFDDPRALTEADWFRLTFCDSPGSDPRVFPYSVNSPDVSELPKKYCIDRYWGPKYRDADLPKLSSDVAAESWVTTRYLCCGFAFGVVGRYSDDKSDMFTVFIREHMQHHYFKLGLIAHFGRASLLAFDDRLALAVQHRKMGEETEFREDVKELEQDFVTFRSRYWFSEVSNHLQGRELFDWWAGHLEVDSLFQQVQGKIDAVAESIDRQETAELNELVKKMTVWSIALATSALGIALLALVNDTDLSNEIIRVPTNRALFTILMAVGTVYVFWTIAYQQISSKLDQTHRQSKRRG